MEIHSRNLTTCEVTSDGQIISLGFIDASGTPAAVKLPLEQVSALAMTLPTLIEKALRKQFGDDSLRYTYQLGSWSLERSAFPGTSIVTLRATDGFGVCFSIQQQQQSELAEAFTTEPEPTPVSLTN